MRVLLLKPCWTYPADPGDSTYNRAWPPLSLLTCAAMLEKRNIAVEVLDASARHIEMDEIIRKALVSDKVFITSAGLDRWQCPNLNLDPLIKTIFALKKTSKELFVMGTHGAVRTKELLDITGVTAVVVGEPEETVVDICSEKSLKDIPGIAFYDNEKYIQTPGRKDADIRNFPIPAYHHVDISNYRYEILGDRFALLEASRGCPYQCIFCVKTMYGQTFRVKKTDQFIREIDFIIDDVKAENAYFIDLEFTVNRPLVEAVCRHLIERNAPLSWCCQTRADSVDETLLKMMRAAGCKVVHFGVETGSERIRRTLRKGITFEQIENGLKAARAAGLQTVCFFMFGLPGETLEDMEQTIRFAKRLNPTYASFHIALPYPGTVFYDQVEKELRGELFPPAYTGIVPYEKLLKTTRKAFRTFYLRPSYIAGRLKDQDLSVFWQQAKFFLSYLKHRLWS